MTDQEVADFLSNEWGRPVSLVEAQEINLDVTSLAKIVVDAFLESQKAKNVEYTKNAFKCSTRNLTY